MMTPYVTNVTPFQALAITQAFYNGVLHDCLFVKATFRLTQEGRLLPLLKQPPFAINDIYEGKDDVTALAQASEIIAYKPGTDVVVTGHAKPPGGIPVEQWLAHIDVGSVDKTVMLTGPRHWRYHPLGGWKLSNIEPASSVRLSYGLAYGGASDSRREVPADIYWPNPFGRGYLGRDRPDTHRNYPAAQIVPLSQVMLEWGRDIESVGLSFVDGQQQARLQFAGTYDENWKKNVAPNIPLDMKMEFWNTVPQDQVARPSLRGGERVRTHGLFPTPDGMLAFELPRYNVFAVPIRGNLKDSSTPMHLDTVHLDVDKQHVTIRWATLYDRADGYDEYEVVAMPGDEPSADKAAA